MKVGIYPDCTNEDYHANPAISRSGIMMFNKSPYKFWAHYLNPNRPHKESTKVMEFGSAFHTFVLEPDLFHDTYCLEPAYEQLPTKVLLKNVGRPLYEAYKLEKSKIDYINEVRKQEHEERVAEKGKIVLSLNDYHILQSMRTAITSHTEASSLIEKAKYEQSYFWQDKESGLYVKSRPDILHDNMIVDLKTCASASSRAYQRVMLDSGYHIQGAMCREGVRIVEGRDIPNVINVCVEKTYPYQIGIKIISEEALAEGHRVFKDSLMRMAECFDKNEWPSYEVETVDLPKWY